MRIKSLFTTVLVGLMLVVGIDYVSFAATGQSLVLGKLNKANKATIIQRTTAGPALNLRVPAGSAPLSTNSKARVGNLNADQVDGREGADLAGRSSVSSFRATACQDARNVGRTPVKIGDLGTFAATGAGFVRVDFETTVERTASGPYGVALELRVDGSTAFTGDGSLLLSTAPRPSTASFTSVFKDLPAGTRTVSLWANATGVTDDTVDEVRYDVGCFRSHRVNNVIVTQFD